MPRRTRRTLLVAGVATAAALGAAASPAAASDETLKAEIQAIEVELRPALDEFVAATKAVARAQDTTRLQEATQGFRAGLSRYKWGVINRKASTPEGLAAKKQLLTAIRQFDIGLVEYETALERLDAGASRRAVVLPLRTADRRFTEGAKDEAAALQALGLGGTA